jgi:hypothetical protein
VRFRQPSTPLRSAISASRGDVATQELVERDIELCAEVEERLQREARRSTGECLAAVNDQ